MPRKHSLPLLKRRLQNVRRKLSHDITFEWRTRKKHWVIKSSQLVLSTIALTALAIYLLQASMFGEGMVMVGLIAAIWCSFAIELFLSMYGAKGSIHKWALEEKEKQQLLDRRTPTTINEMEELMNLHIKHGNIDEADKISQQLLVMAEGNPLSSAQPPAIAQDTVIKIKKSNGLPSWMDDKEKEKETDPSKLPSWME